MRKKKILGLNQIPKGMLLNGSGQAVAPTNDTSLTKDQVKALCLKVALNSYDEGAAAVLTAIRSHMEAVKARGNTVVTFEELDGLLVALRGFVDEELAKAKKEQGL